MAYLIDQLELGTLLLDCHNHINWYGRGSQYLDEFRVERLCERFDQRATDGSLASLIKLTADVQTRYHAVNAELQARFSNE